MTSCRVSRSIASIRSISAGPMAASFGAPFSRIVLGSATPGSRRRGPSPRRPEPRSRTRCGSDFPEPRCRPFPGGCNAEPWDLAGCQGPDFRGCDFDARRVNTTARPISVEDRVDFAIWPADLAVLAQVVMIDVALAGDNAVVGRDGGRRPAARQRRSAMLLGIGGAALLRILLGTRGAAVAGHHRADTGGRVAAAVGVLAHVSGVARPAPHAHGEGGTEKTLRQAMWQIIVADLSMSLDNVLAVAGAAHGHPWVLVAGPAAVGRADGRGGDPDRAGAEPVPLDRLGRPADRAARGDRA